jgi:hypothetical protein
LDEQELKTQSASAEVSAPADDQRDPEAARAAGAGLRALADDPADHA